MKSWRAYTSEIAAAPGDVLTLGFTSKLRKALNDGVDPVDKESKTYKGTALGTTLASMVTGAGAVRTLGKGAAKAAKQAASKAPKKTKMAPAHKGPSVQNKSKQLAKSFREKQREAADKKVNLNDKKAVDDRAQAQRLSTKSNPKPPQERRATPRTAEHPRTPKPKSFASFKARQQHG